MGHKVKCVYCGQQFDRDTTPCCAINGRRYAHTDCVQQAQTKAQKDEQDKAALENYIKNLFDIPELPKRVQQQIKIYVRDNQYTYSGILKALIYFYEVKKNSIERANGGIGIVPYIYEESRNYYYNLWLTNQSNQQKMLDNNYIPTVKVVKIPLPHKKIKKRKRFAFLDEEGDE